MGCHHSAPTDAERMDENNDGKISRQELFKYIEANANLWAMLAVNLNLPEQQCREIATEVAYNLAKQIKQRDKTNKQHDQNLALSDREPTVAEIQAFIDFIKDPKGEQEFFHRTVCQAFDLDGNGYLDPDELDKFLDIFYEADSIFKGDARLPPKQELKKRIMTEFDTNGDGKLDFHELQPVISGGAKCFVTPQ